MKTNLLFVVLAGMLLAACSKDSSSESAELNVGTSLLEFPQAGGSLTLSVTSNSNWSVSSLPNWLSSSAVSGIGNSTVTLSATANESIDDRSGSFMVVSNDGSIKKTVNVTQAGTHVSPLQVDNTSERVFNGALSSVDEASIEVTSNTRWIIEGPSWLSATFNNNAVSLNGDAIREGSGTISLRVKQTHSETDARSASITLKTVSSDKSITIPVRQLGRYDVVLNKDLILSDGIASSMKFGASVAYISFYIFEGDAPVHEITYENISKLWSSSQIQDDTNLYFGGLSANQDYTIAIIATNADNYYAPLSKVNYCSFRTLTDANQPRVTISDLSVKDGHWHFFAQMNEYTGSYLVANFYASYFEGWDQRFIKTYLAYSMYTEPVSAMSRESTTWDTYEAQDLFICTWAYSPSGQLSNVVDMTYAKQQASSRSAAPSTRPVGYAIGKGPFMQTPLVKNGIKTRLAR